MINFLDAIAKYWAIITWFISMSFAMGVMWVKVETSARAFRILFEKTDKAQSFMDGQTAKNEAFEKRMQELAQTSRDHAQEDSKKFGELTGRLDQIFALLTQHKV